MLGSYHCPLQRFTVENILIQYTLPNSHVDMIQKLSNPGLDINSVFGQVGCLTQLPDEASKKEVVNLPHSCL